MSEVNSRDNSIEADPFVPPGWSITTLKTPPDRTVWAIGAEVTIGGDIPARVLEAAIKTSGEEYRVVWWSGENRISEWLDSSELTGGKLSGKLEIGFRHE